MAKRVLVLVIEGKPAVRDTLAALLAEHPELEVVAAESAAAGLVQLREAKPDVILVDAAVGNEDGAHGLVHDLKRQAPKVPVIVMDLLPVQQQVAAFVRAGANGFIVKDATLDDFARTIRSASSLLQPARMTKREREITDLIVQGMSNKQIAQTLNIAVYTVKSHVHNILQKLALDTRRDIAAHLQRTDLRDTDAPAQHPWAGTEPSRSE